MSRSGYSDDISSWQLICWRGAVASSTKGRRGQAFFNDLLNALDSMPIKRLIKNELELAGEFCAIGVLGNSRKVDMAKIDVDSPTQVGVAFNIAKALAQEVVFMNDEYCDYEVEEPEERWVRMRKWVAEQISGGDE